MEAVNKRQSEFDYAKTFAIFFMVIIHVIEEMSTVNTEILPTGTLNNLVQFFAGPMAAPVFIFAMGIGIVYSRHQEPIELLRRGIKLFLVAFVLNIVRDVIPRLLVCAISGAMPEWHEFRYQLFCVEVLHFAGLAFMLTALLRKLRVPIWGLIPIGIVMQIVGNTLSETYAPSGVTEILLSYIYKAGDLSYFPIMNWYLSLAVGMVAGTLIKKYNDRMDRVYRSAFWIALSLQSGFMLSCSHYGIDKRLFYSICEDVFYRQMFFNFMYNTIIIVLELSIFHYIDKKLSRRIYPFVGFCGKNLTTIYVVQWIIVGWLTSFQDYLNLHPGLEMSVVLGILIALLSILITKILPRIRW